MSILDDIKTGASSFLNPKSSPVVDAKLAILGRMTMAQLLDIWKKWVFVEIPVSGVSGSNILLAKSMESGQDKKKERQRSQVVMDIASNLTLDQIVRLAKEIKIDLEGIVKTDG